MGLDDPELASYLVQENHYWMDAETAIHGFASQPYRGQKASEAFVSALIENYGSRSDLEKKLGERIKYHWELE